MDSNDLEQARVLVEQAEQVITRVEAIAREKGDRDQIRSMRGIGLELSLTLDRIERLQREMARAESQEAA